jgi:hypothetical protein
MTRTPQTLPAETGGTEITRFNALRHGVLSRYTVLPWEDADEYQATVTALVAEHVPRAPTEEHLVEEIAGIMWRKRRLRLVEARRNAGAQSRNGQGSPCPSRHHRPVRTGGRCDPRHGGGHRGRHGRYGGG